MGDSIVDPDLRNGPRYRARCNVVQRWLVLGLVACGRPDPAARMPPPPQATRPPSATSDAAIASCAPPPALGEGLVSEIRPITATPAMPGPACLDVVRADLDRFRPRVLTASHDGGPGTALEWRDRLHLAAVINAGMFHETGVPVGMIVETGQQIAGDNTQMGGFLAFDPVSPADPAAIVTGRDCVGFDLVALRSRYRSIVQSYRLLDCRGAATPWQDKKQYSAAAVGVDRNGRLVFLHARAAVTMSELSTAIAQLDLIGALFLEGGPEASLVVGKLALLGSYETHFNENDDNAEFWSLPNVIAIEPRQ